MKLIVETLSGRERGMQGWVITRRAGMPKLSALHALSATILVVTDSAVDDQRRRGCARHGQARRLEHLDAPVLGVPSHFLTGLLEVPSHQRGERRPSDGLGPWGCIHFLR